MREATARQGASLAAAMLIITAPVGAQKVYPKLEAYRICGVEAAMQMMRAEPARPANDIARIATKGCEAKLAAAAEETLKKNELRDGREQVMADFRRRSIADLEQRIVSFRTENRGN